MSHRRAGKFSECELADLLRELQEARATGLLVLTRNAEQKSLYLRDGNIVFASSNQARDRLGEILMQSGQVTRAQHDVASDVLRKTGRRFGTILVELGFIGPKQLFDAVKQQVREIVITLFRWNDGTYEFTPGTLPEATIPLPIDPVQLVSEIIQRLEQEKTVP
jgi:hypothetical protein